MLFSIKLSMCLLSKDNSEKIFFSSSLSSLTLGSSVATLAFKLSPNAGNNSSSTASALSTNFAPDLIRLLVPLLLGEVTFPGTAKTSLPCSKAKSAVIKAPLFSAASTTTVPKAKPLSILFLAGKLFRSGRMKTGNSDKIAPCSAICFLKLIFSGGYVCPKPQPKTAIVSAPADKAALWANVSIPLAKPLIILNPAEASFKQSLSATSFPYSEGVRVPTTAKGRVMEFKGFPFIYKIGGGS